MNLEYSEEQLILKNAARDFLATECPASLLREIMDGDALHSPELWETIAELGWLGLAFPSKYGGEDCTFLDFTTMLEEAGRALLPLPLLQTVIAGLTILKAGSEEQKTDLLPKIAKGKTMATLAIAEEDGDFHPDSIATKAVADGDGYKLTGSKCYVTYAPLMDVLIVAARTGGDTGEKGISLFIVEGKDPAVKCEQLKSVTGLKPFRITLDGVKVAKDMVLGEKDNAWPLISRILLFEGAAKCSVALGSAEKVLEMTVEIAKTRIQFGRPIGVFQAVQQLCADVVIDVDSIRYVTHQAASLLSDDVPCAKEVAIARVCTDQAYKRLVALAVKIHGGVGFTREHDVGLHFLNALEDELPFSHDDFYRRTIAAAIN